jgi:hypothetical protein
MGTKIRVFIASTVEDLENERNQVVTRVRQLNFEPVNAEGWATTGTPPWERIRKELESCHLFVLILGKRYGYIPADGPGAADGLSVTHMETRKARELGLPVLPFLKRLKYASEPDERRDRFRAEVSDWAAGGVVNEFDLADDLADKVAASLVEVLSETYLTSEVRRRASETREAGRRIEEEEDEVTAEAEHPVIPPPLIELARRGLTLVAGAGISLAAGFPSALALTEVVTNILRRAQGDPDLNLTGVPFQEIASNIETAFGRDYLLKIFLRGMSGPQGIEPTVAHSLGVSLAKKIVTTNFDNLFEAACDAHGIPYAVFEDDGDITARAPAEDAVLIYKLSGSLSRPEKLLITEQDVWNSRARNPVMWQRVIEEVTGSNVLIIGSSLRDLSIKRIFYDGGRAVRGFIISPYMNSFELLRYKNLQLHPVRATADAFFRQLYVEAGRPRLGSPREN